MNDWIRSNEFLVNLIYLIISKTQALSKLEKYMKYNIYLIKWKMNEWKKKNSENVKFANKQTTLVNMETLNISAVLFIATSGAEVTRFTFERGWCITACCCSEMCWKDTPCNM